MFATAIIVFREILEAALIVGIVAAATRTIPARTRWYDYSRARDVMLKKTDTKRAPWVLVPSDDKRAARLNTIAHVLSAIPYKKLPHKKVGLPPRSEKHAYNDKKSISNRRFVKERY